MKAVAGLTSLAVGTSAAAAAAADVITPSLRSTILLTCTSTTVKPRVKRETSLRG